MAQELNSLRISSVQWNKDLPFVNRFDKPQPFGLNGKEQYSNVYWKATTSPFLDNFKNRENNTNSEECRFFPTQRDRSRSQPATNHAYAETPCRRSVVGFPHEDGCLVQVSRTSTSSSSSPSPLPSSISQTSSTTKRMNIYDGDVGELDTFPTRHQNEKESTKTETLIPLSETINGEEITTKIVVSPLVSEFLNRKNEENLVQKLLMEEAEKQSKALVLYKSPPNLLEFCQQDKNSEMHSLTQQQQQQSTSDTITSDLSRKRKSTEDEVPPLQSSDDEKMDSESNTVEEEIIAIENTDHCITSSTSSCPDPQPLSSFTPTNSLNYMNLSLQHPPFNSNTTAYYYENAYNNQNNIQTILTQNNLPLPQSLLQQTNDHHEFFDLTEQPFRVDKSFSFE